MRENKRISIFFSLMYFNLAYMYSFVDGFRTDYRRFWWLRACVCTERSETMTVTFCGHTHTHTQRGKDFCFFSFIRSVDCNTSSSIFHSTSSSCSGPVFFFSRAPFLVIFRFYCRNEVKRNLCVLLLLLLLFINGRIIVILF